MINLPSYISPETQRKIEEYIEWSPSRSSEKIEVEKLLKNVTSPQHAKDIEERFAKRLQFGTAGLRGKMGCGFNRINDLIVIQTTQGLATHLLQKYGQKICTERGVVIGYDGRHYSKRYAHATAAVFLSKNFKVYLNSSVVATPIIPFSIKYYNCLSGVQITASHNPKDDNGYKVYAENGAQIISPMDTVVSALILNNLKPWDDAINLLDLTAGLLDGNKLNTITCRNLESLNHIENLRLSSLLHDPMNEIVEQYLKTIKNELLTENDYKSIKNTKLQFVYTPMHGVGYRFVSKLLIDYFGLPSENFHVIKEQQHPDPEFRTVKFPNPEEKGALDLSIELANKLNIPIIIANDPDVDRFACAEKTSGSSEWRIFTGDELGILFATYIYEKKKNLLKENFKKENMLFLCSAVSSRMLQRFCEVEGCKFAETMTGFKWIMNKAIELCENNQNHFCFAYEEALGYALSLNVPDKDGISACGVWIQMACSLYEKGLTISERLEQIYSRYGYSITNNSYFLCYDTALIQQIFREFRQEGKYKPQLGNSKIKRIRDVTMRYDNGESNMLCKLPFIPSSEMITLYFDNNVTITFRTSGTEPKLKYYAEIINSNPTEAKQQLEDTINDSIEHFIQYPKYKQTLIKA